MEKIILLLLGTIIVAIGAVMVFDARTITTKAFNSREINETTKIIKVVGFIVSLIGLGMIYILQYK